MAFWGAGAIDHLGLRAYPDEVKVLLDLSAGASNPTEVAALLDLFPDRVRAVERLHAKAWISDGELLVGSANASANGLGVEGSESRHWCELGLVSSDQEIVEEAKAWFDDLWSKRSSEITTADLKRAQELWKRRRVMRPREHATGTLLEVGSTRPEILKDRRIYVAVVNADLSAKGKVELARLSANAGAELHAYEDWPRIPLDAVLVAFTNYDGVLDRDERALYKTQTERQAGRLQVVYPARDAFGYAVGSISEWKKRIKLFASRKPRKWNKGDMCVELLEFLEATK